MCFRIVQTACFFAWCITPVGNRLKLFGYPHRLCSQPSRVRCFLWFIPLWMISFWSSSFNHLVESFRRVSTLLGYWQSSIVRDTAHILSKSRHLSICRISSGQQYSTALWAGSSRSNALWWIRRKRLPPDIGSVPKCSFFFPWQNQTLDLLQAIAPRVHGSIRIHCENLGDADAEKLVLCFKTLVRVNEVEVEFKGESREMSPHFLRLWICPASSLGKVENRCSYFDWVSLRKTILVMPMLRKLEITCRVIDDDEALLKVC